MTAGTPGHNFASKNTAEDSMAGTGAATGSVMERQAAPRARILVIDDEGEIRESLEALLTSEGYEVELAQNATEGERKLESRAWDLVLLDLMMPDKSGMEVLRDIRERDRHTPIFMITAWGGVEAAVQ